MSASGKNGSDFGQFQPGDLRDRSFQPGTPPQMGFELPPAGQQMPSFGGGGKSTPSPWTPRFNPTQPNPIGIPIGQQPVNPPMNQPIRQRSGTGGPILNNRLPQLQPGAAPVPPSTPMPTPGMPGGKSYGPMVTNAETQYSDEFDQISGESPRDANGNYYGN